MEKVAMVIEPTTVQKKRIIRVFLLKSMVRTSLGVERLAAESSATEGPFR